MDDPPIEVVLFDLGGVLFDFAGVGAMKHLTGIGSDDELWRRWLSCPWVRDFERGQCSADAFATGLVEEWALRVEPREFLENFEGWALGPLLGAEELVRAVRRTVRVACLSNTNSLHWDALAGSSLLDVFDVRFLSFEMGMLKPDREVFERVVHLLRVASPRRVLFLDDNVLNVDAARSVGLCAATVSGVTEARQALVAASVLGQ